MEPHDTSVKASANLDRSHHDLAQPLQAILLNQEDMQERIGSTAALLEKLSRAVLGDKEYYQPGILPTLEDHEKRIRTLENWRLGLLGGAAVAAAIWAVVQHFFK